ncbi:MAG TPA: hypothetical protein VFN10_21945 [Thermoanaerobaculia bacterium]|nr:hypothetical protein [Thermoanaerobaculia bacterium]
MANHHWSEADDIAAFYVYRFGAEKLGQSVTDIAHSFGIKPGSFRMRIKNFQALDGKGGLENWASQSEEVYRRYGRADEEALRRLVVSSRRKAD